MKDFFKRLLCKTPKKENEDMDFIIAALGNPGSKYATTRHNAGFLAASYIAEKHSARISKVKFKSLSTEININGKKVLLLCPQTFMNLSGGAVREAATFYKLPPERIVVLCDDVALPLGKIRIRPKGSNGGHNGLKDIIINLNSDNFPRVRMGVSAPPEHYDMADWVLKEFTSEEKKILLEKFEDVYGAVCLIIKGKTADAMNKYN